jgi:hypothetical protein
MEALPEEEDSADDLDETDNIRQDSVDDALAKEAEPELLASEFPLPEEQVSESAIRELPTPEGSSDVQHLEDGLPLSHNGDTAVVNGSEEADTVDQALIMSSSTKDQTSGYVPVPPNKRVLQRVCN